MPDDRMWESVRDDLKYIRGRVDTQNDLVMALAKMFEGHINAPGHVDTIRTNAKQDVEIAELQKHRWTLSAAVLTILLAAGGAILKVSF